MEIPAEVRCRMHALARQFRREPTESERILWLGIRNRALGVKFRRQQPVGPFIADFFCAEKSLIVEVDGPIHAEQIEYDRERQALLEACGYRVLRVSAAEVISDPAAVQVCIARALELPPSLLDGEGGQGGEVQSGGYAEEPETAEEVALAHATALPLLSDEDWH